MSRSSAVIATMVVFGLSLPRVAALAGCVGDITEPNDASTSAYLLPCDATLQSRVFPTCVDPLGDLDYYAIDLAAGQVFSMYFGSVWFESLEVSFYDTDGITLLESAQMPNSQFVFSTRVVTGGRYYFSIGSFAAETGLYLASIRCRDMVTAPPLVANTLIVSKQGGNVTLTWNKPVDVNLDPPDSYEIWRALPTTISAYDFLASSSARLFDLGPLASRPPVEFYRVRAVNAVGPDGPVPAFVRFELFPKQETDIDATLVASVDPCETPNVHPELPLMVQATMRDRSGQPLDGHQVTIRAVSSGPVGTFCPVGASRFETSGTTGSSGPGSFIAEYSLSDDELGQCGPFWCFIEFHGDSSDFGASGDRPFFRWFPR